MMYVVRERVTFVYTFRVEADSEKDAKRKVKTMGDGEADDHEEGARRFLSVEKAR